jgi:hypothetical protein
VLQPRVRAQPGSNGSDGGRSSKKGSNGGDGLYRKKIFDGEIWLHGGLIFLGFQRGKKGGDVGVFIGILFRAKRVKIEREPEILVVSSGDELVQFVVSVGARGRPVRQDPRAREKKRIEKDGGGWLLRDCFGLLRGRAQRWCWPAWPAWPGRSVFFFPSFILLWYLLNNSI